MKLQRGIVAVYKPKGPTSHDVINIVRRATGEKRVGHAGTLDPLARGVLVVAIGREYTKKLGEIVATEKEYIAEIRLGETSTTDDAEGEKTKGDRQASNIKEIQHVLKQFVGEIEQTPPLYSAVKIDGKEAYKYARKGKTVEMKPRKAWIKEIELLSYDWPNLRVRVVTGKGVYIRSLARDIGETLGVGGYLSDLERTRVGEYRKEDAVDIDAIAV